MEITLFDMDGVLLEPKGYHRALQETVRLAGLSMGYGEVLLADDQIAQFEALGISSEWHSSALCMAAMMLARQKALALVGNGNQQFAEFDLRELFAAISTQPLRQSARQRAVAAIEGLAQKAGVAPDPILEIVATSESIIHSPTLNWFQELILGSEIFERTYQKKPQLQTESYLKLYDQPLLSKPMAASILSSHRLPGHGAAIMTNRPSSGPPGFVGAPDAKMGAVLVGLADLPIVGYGEVTWLAEQTGREPRELAKPAWQHALAAILAASGWSVKDSLVYAGQQSKRDDLSHLQNSTIHVFEDTPGGMVAVQEAGILLTDMGLNIAVQKIGITEDMAKQSALSDQGAIVYPSINQALAAL